MELNAIQRHAICILVLLDFYAVRVVRANFVQREDVKHHQRK